MKVMIDSHMVVWSAVLPSKISAAAREIIQTADVFVSAASWWEISIKYSIGKLKLAGGTPSDLWLECQRMGFGLLPVTGEEASSVYLLKAIHRDPFDRLIIWQAIQNNLPLISDDRFFTAYQSLGLKLIP